MGATAGLGATSTCDITDTELAVRGALSGGNGDRLVRALIESADAYRFDAVEQPLLHRRVAGVERLLLAPRLDDHPVARASDLLEGFHRGAAVLLRRRVGDRRAARRRRRGRDDAAVSR
jgi:hypothetical protein